MGRGSHRGQKGDRGGKVGKHDERLVRNDDLDARYNATPASTSTNATHFLFCLSLYMRRIIVPSDHYLKTTECFIKFSKYMSWLLRFGRELLHPQSLSLTLHELFHFGLFERHVNTCRTFIDQDPYHIFGNSGTTEVFNECKRCNINIDSMRWFIPFATVVWHNSRGRIAFSVLNTDLVREPLATEWCTTDMTVDEILTKIRHNGSNGGYKQNNIFFRAQSGHGGLREEQRPGVPYDFRHNILIHKTKAPLWRQMSRSQDRFLRCQNRDIHLAPIQFLLTDPEMLRQYGGRVLLFNMNVERTVCRDHVLNNSREYHNVSTFYLSIVVLNLGNILRQPRFANNKRFPSEIRNNPERLRENLVLPYLVVNNPGHIITLCESYDFMHFHNLCVEYNNIGVQCMSNKQRHASPPISIFVKSTQGMVEVLHHFDAAKDTGSSSDGWLLHGVIARCVFGPQSHKIDEYTRERTERRYTGEDVTSYAFYDDSRYNTHGMKNVVTNENQLDDIEATYDDIADESYSTTSGFTDHFVQRLGLGEIRVLCLHINSYAFRHSINTIRRYLRLVFSKALFEQVDFITGDFNLFLNRQFSTDLGGSIYGGLVIEVLEDAVRAMNEHFVDAVTFNVSSSTPAREVYDFLEHGNINANVDCMACISLFYNKQLFEQERPPPLIEDRRIAHDYLHNILERPRQFTTCAWGKRTATGTFH